MKTILVYSGEVSRHRTRVGDIASVEMISFAKFCEEAEINDVVKQAMNLGAICVNIRKLDLGDPIEMARICLLSQMAELGHDGLDHDADEDELVN